MRRSRRGEQFRYGFGNALSPDESDALYERWTIPSPGKPLFEAAIANFKPHSPAKIDTKHADRVPLLLTAGGKDHTVPPTVVKATLKRYQGSGAITELEEFPDRGHSLGIDSGWRDVADTVSPGSASRTWSERHRARKGRLSRVRPRWPSASSRCAS